MTITLEEVSCKFCNSKNVIRYGIHKNMQCCWCKDCRRKFVVNRALPRMKVALDIAGPAVGYYFEGKPVHIIIQKILNKYGIYVSSATIYEWVDRFSRMGADGLNRFRPEVGDTWIVNETEADICDDRYHFIDIIDTDTQYIIATTFFTRPSSAAFNHLMESARDRVGKMPKSIVILGSGDNLNRSMIEDSFRDEEINVIVLDEEKSWMLTKHFKDALLTRSQILSRLKKQENIEKIINGWLDHYNFHRKNKSLDGKTPAERANISFNPRVVPSKWMT